ncbi:MAG: 50S ribosomal protein L22 [Candidatus Omnitrophica bacterium]|nr:50S ribosomal protein L22 [Candidatus Omnitrophota bacterium]MDD5553300.1 50S ribosomal protein L22 [Candidatus Omnitrophota bacterium]
MIAKAEAKFLRLSPSKVRQVIDVIRHKSVIEAGAILKNLNKRPKEYLIKILNQAAANAKVKGFNPEQLYISKLVCNEGPRWKRFKAAAFGRASPIKKRTSHISMELDIRQGRKGD